MRRVETSVGWRRSVAPTSTYMRRKSAQPLQYRRFPTSAPIHLHRLTTLQLQWLACFLRGLRPDVGGYAREWGDMLKRGLLVAERFTRSAPIAHAGGASSRHARLHRGGGGRRPCSRGLRRARQHNGGLPSRSRPGRSRADRRAHARPDRQRLLGARDATGRALRCPRSPPPLRRRAGRRPCGQPDLFAATRVAPPCCCASLCHGAGRYPARHDDSPASAGPPVFPFISLSG